jgi:uncharacterized membrane protein
MDIEYFVDTEDLVAAGVAFSENSKELGTRRRIEQVSVALYVILFFVTVFIIRKQINFLLLGLGLGMLVFILWPTLQVRSARRRFSREYRALDHHALLGRRVLQLEGDRIEERSELTWSKFKLAAIEQIIHSDTHTMLFLTPYTFIVIPHTKLVDGDIDAFVHLLRQQANQSGAEITSEATA